MPRQGRYSFPRRLIHFAALGFGAGKVPVAPGTFGTLVAVPIYLSLRETGIVAYALTVAAMFVAGVWLCDVTERDLEAHDAPSIVWDEIVGYLVTKRRRRSVRFSAVTCGSAVPSTFRCAD